MERRDRELLDRHVSSSDDEEAAPQWAKLGTIEPSSTLEAACQCPLHCPRKIYYDKAVTRWALCPGCFAKVGCLNAVANFFAARAARFQDALDALKKAELTLAELGVERA